jgi:hypothetical protein
MLYLRLVAAQERIADLQQQLDDALPKPDEEKPE